VPRASGPAGVRAGGRRLAVLVAADETKNETRKPHRGIGCANSARIPLTTGV